MAKIHDDIEFQNQELRRIVARLADQDNRCTAEPLYIVERSRLVCPIESEFADMFAFYSEGEMVAREHWPALEEHYEKTQFSMDDADKVIEIEGFEYDLSDNVSRYGAVEQWEAAAWFLTEEAAQEYLERNKHNLRGFNEPRIYVESMNRGVEMIVLRAALPRLVAMLDESKAQAERIKELEAARDTATREMSAYARRCGELEAQLCGQLVEHPGRKAMLLVLAELRRAKLKHPDFKPTLAQALNVLDDECEELDEAVSKGNIHGEHGVIREAAQCAAVNLRIIEMALGMVEVAA